MSKMVNLKVDPKGLEELAGEIGQSFRFHYFEDGVRAYQLSPDKRAHGILPALIAEVKGLYSDPFRESFIYEALLAIQGGPGRCFEKHPKLFDLVAWLRADADRRVNYMTDAITFGETEGIEILYHGYHIERMEVLDIVERVLKREIQNG